MKKTTVSIIMATYNRAHLIETILQSILNQTYGNWECLIIDDGSTDETKTIVQEYENLDSRFKYSFRPKEYKKSLPGCRNYGLDKARGKYIIFFDDDDLVHPQNLEICLKLIEKSKTDFINYQKLVFYNEPPKFEEININDISVENFGTKDIPAFITGQKAMASCTVMWNKSCFNGIRFNEDLHYAEEWECYTRMLLGGCNGVSIDVTLYFNKKHSNSNTGEFNNGDELRRNSMIKAAHAVIKEVDKHNKLNQELKKFFIRLGFRLKEFSIIEKTLEVYGSGIVEKLKYNLGYTFYPFIKPFFKLKAKVKNG